MSSKLSVAIHILTVLALHKPECGPSTSEFIAGSVNTNPVVIRRLLGLMREAGYVDSKKGVGGGWVLLVDPKQITLLDVLKAVEPDNEIFALHRAEPNIECPCGRFIQGVLVDVYADVQAGMTQQLARSTIGSVKETILARMQDQSPAPA
jgi:Rrf2 family protein